MLESGREVVESDQSGRFVRDKRHVGRSVELEHKIRTIECMTVLPLQPNLKRDLLCSLRLYRLYHYPTYLNIQRHKLRSGKQASLGALIKVNFLMVFRKVVKSEAE